MCYKTLIKYWVIYTQDLENLAQLQIVYFKENHIKRLLRSVQIKPFHIIEKYVTFDIKFTNDPDYLSIQTIKNVSEVQPNATNGYIMMSFWHSNQLSIMNYHCLYPRTSKDI